MQPTTCEVIIERSGDAWRAAIKLRDRSGLVEMETFHTYPNLSDILLDVRAACEGLG